MSIDILCSLVHEPATVILGQYAPDLTTWSIQQAMVSQQQLQRATC